MQVHYNKFIRIFYYLLYHYLTLLTNMIILFHGKLLSHCIAYTNHNHMPDHGLCIYACRYYGHDYFSTKIALMPLLLTFKVLKMETR